eukprot:2337348-Amphidinium_carterae.1
MTPCHHWTGCPDISEEWTVYVILAEPRPRSITSSGSANILSPFHLSPRFRTAYCPLAGCLLLLFFHSALMGSVALQHWLDMEPRTPAPSLPALPSDLGRSRAQPVKGHSDNQERVECS